MFFYVIKFYLFTIEEEVLGTRLEVCEEKDYRFVKVIGCEDCL